MARWTLSLCFFVVVATGVGCGETREEVEPVCVLVREGALEDEDDYSEDEPVAMRSMRWEEWVELLTDARPEQRASRDCSGRPIQYREEDGCAGGQGERVEAVPIDEESVIVSRVDQDERLVWVVTHRYSNGDGLGPVAHVRLENERAKVLALGQLRGRTGRARLREIGLGAGMVLVQEGETCGRADLPETCHRSARLLPRMEQQFVPRSLMLPGGRCAGPGEVILTDRMDVELRTGWLRGFTRFSSIDTEGSTVVVHEQISAADRDPSTPNVPPRTVRELNSDRIIRMDRGGRLLLSKPFHWSSLVRICGSTEAPHVLESRDRINRDDYVDLVDLCSERQQEELGTDDLQREGPRPTRR